MELNKTYDNTNVEDIWGNWIKTPLVCYPYEGELPEDLDVINHRLITVLNHSANLYPKGEVYINKEGKKNLLH